jgi:hypothetical protein
VRCLWCRRKIGSLRRYFDNEYCCSEHRKLAKTDSSRDLRDAGHMYGEEDDEYTVMARPEQKKGQIKSKASFGGFAILLGLFLLAMIWMPQGSQQAPVAPEKDSYTPRPETYWSRFRENLPSPGRASFDIGEDFHSGLKDWNLSGLGGGSSSWVVQAGSVRPRELRFWTPSMKLKDYDLDFQAQIEQRAIGWAFRAKDVHNYYAAKIVLERPAPFPVSEIVRYAVVNGEEQARTQLPLPMQLQKGTFYKVRVHIKGDRFVTSVNGAVVDTWTDRRLRAGGVGFFTDAGEEASIMAVRVSEDRSLIERLFVPALFVHPDLWQ